MTGMIAPSAYIGDQVELGTNVRIGPGAVILGPAVIGDNVYIGGGSQIGAPAEISSLPQNAAWAGEISGFGVVIGDGTVIRENVVIHQGSHRPTTVGKNCWILNSSYLAHDVQLGDNTTVSAGVRFGGHCLVGANVNIGMSAVVHQRRIIADGAMVGMATPVTADVPPFAKVYGSPARLQGINRVGLERSGYSLEVITALTSAYGANNLLLRASDMPAALTDLQPAFALWHSQELKPIKTVF